MPLVFYHRTSEEGAVAIERGGFRDGIGTYGFEGLEAPVEGVFISNWPAELPDGASEGPLLRLHVRATWSEMAPFAVIEEGDTRVFREWIVPASFLNERARIERVAENEESELLAKRTQLEFDSFDRVESE